MNSAIPSIRVTAAARTVCLICILAAIGCNPPGKRQALSELQQRLDRMELERDRFANLYEDGQQEIQAKERLIENLRKLGPGKERRFFPVDHINIVSLTGGADYDGQPGDDGITVYLRPVDIDGDVIKSVGEITIRLVDNAVTGPPRLLGQYVVSDFEDLRRAWYGGFLTDHYTIKCPWSRTPEGKPSTPEVEIKVTFLESLTGKLHTAHRTVHVSLVEPA